MKSIFKRICAGITCMIVACSVLLVPAGAEVPREISVFMGGNSTEYPYMYLNYGGFTTNEGFFVTDHDSKTVWRFPLSAEATIATLVADVAANYTLEVSADAITWKMWAKAEGGENAHEMTTENRREEILDITSYIPGGQIYVRLGDQTPLSGWGGALYSLKLKYYAYNPEPAITEVPVYNMQNASDLDRAVAAGTYTGITERMETDFRTSGNVTKQFFFTLADRADVYLNFWRTPCEEDPNSLNQEIMFDLYADADCTHLLQSAWINLIGTETRTKSISATLDAGTYYIKAVTNRWNTIDDIGFNFGIQIGAKALRATPDPSPFVPKVTAIKLSKKSKTITVGQKVRVSATVTPYKGAIKWTTSNKNIASISANGKTVTVKGKKPGTATITCLATDGTSIKAKFKVTVKPKKVQTVRFKSGATRLRIKWKKQSGVTGYEVKVSTGKNFKKKNTKTYTLKGAQKIQKTLPIRSGVYYVKVRAYKKIGNKKIYGAFSQRRFCRVLI